MWARSLFIRNFPGKVVLPEGLNIQELTMTLAEQVGQWNKESEKRGLIQGIIQGKLEGQIEGRREGRREGKIEGEALLLQRLLIRRFGSLPSELVKRINQAMPEQIEEWSDRILDAKTLNDVFH